MNPMGACDRNNTKTIKELERNFLQSKGIGCWIAFVLFLVFFSFFIVPIG